MDREALAERVSARLDMDPLAFTTRVDEEAEHLKDAVRDGRFDTSRASVGLEYELYGVDAAGALTRVPRRLLSLIGFDPEVGLHQAELHTSPQPLGRYGLDAQEAELKARLDAALEESLTETIRLVSDGMWTVPPADTTATAYLTDHERVADIVLGTNMTDAVRYHAQSNSPYRPRMRIDAPHVSISGETVMLNGLTTSIQPHYQVPVATDLPGYFRYALRIAGPVLSLGVNSPFFPPDLYDADVDPAAVLADGWKEHRIPVFESVMNPVDGPETVRFPRDIDTVFDGIDRVAGDPVVVPVEAGSGRRFDDQFAHFHHQHSSFWRWVRPVFEGSTEATASVRIEFRPLPSQPTLRDSVAFLALFAGLMESLPRTDHPVRTLDWAVARDNFYAAMRDGIEADLEWITTDGERTSDSARIYEDLLATARDGLERRGLAPAWAERYVAPIQVRADNRITPAGWKRAVVRREIDAGTSLAGAVEAATTAYVRRQADTLIGGDFAEWIAADQRTARSD